MGHEGDGNRSLLKQHVSTFPGELSFREIIKPAIELMYIMMHRHSLSSSLYMSQCMEEVGYLSVRKCSFASLKEYISIFTLHIIML